MTQEQGLPTETMRDRMDVQELLDIYALLFSFTVVDTFTLEQSLQKS